MSMYLNKAVRWSPPTPVNLFPCATHHLPRGHISFLSPESRLTLLTCSDQQNVVKLLLFQFWA